MVSHDTIAAAPMTTLSMPASLGPLEPAGDLLPGLHGRTEIRSPLPAWSAPSVDVVSDPAAFAAMESEWNEAVERASMPHPFLRHEWLRTWWECFGEGARLHLVIVRAAGRILAIAPLMCDTTWMYGVPVRRMRLLQNDHTPRTDMVVTERAHECYRAIWQALLHDSERWDVLQLGQIPRASETLRAFAAFAAEEGHSTGTWPSSDSPYVTLEGTWDSYSASRTRKFRQNIRNRWNRLTAFGEPTLEVLDDRLAVQAASDEALHLEASGWKYTSGTAIGSSAWTHHFYSTLARRAADRGWLRLMFLTVNGRRVATAYAARYRDRLMFIKTGYDPAFAKCSPFMLLTHATLRDAFHSRLAEVDFLGETEPWKLEWTRASRPHDWLFIFAPTLRGQLVHNLKFRLKPALTGPHAVCRTLAPRTPHVAPSHPGTSHLAPRTSHPRTSHPRTSHLAP
jgi:CelD/BcsL family acetyltransferase involved in cellulose biosynthesis